MNTKPIRIIAALLIFGSAACSMFPSLREILIFDRRAIIDGEGWRLFSCHLVHFSTSHLVLDLVVLIASYIIVGAYHAASIEKILMFGCILIGPILFLFDPLLEFYGGTSGLSSAAFLYALKVKYLDAGRALKCFYSCLFLGLVSKTILEIIWNSSLFASLPEGVQAVPLSHLCGFIIAIIIPVTTFKTADSTVCL